MNSAHALSQTGLGLSLGTMELGIDDHCWCHSQGSIVVAVVLVTPIVTTSRAIPLVVIAVLVLLLKYDCHN